MQHKGVYNAQYKKDLRYVTSELTINCFEFRNYKFIRFLNTIHDICTFDYIYVTVFKLNPKSKMGIERGNPGCVLSISQFIERREKNPAVFDIILIDFFFLFFCLCFFRFCFLKNHSNRFFASKVDKTQEMSDFTI